MFFQEHNGAIDIAINITICIHISILKRADKVGEHCNPRLFPPSTGQGKLITSVLPHVNHCIISL